MSKTLALVALFVPCWALFVADSSAQVTGSTTSAAATSAAPATAPPSLLPPKDDDRRGAADAGGNPDDQSLVQIFQKLEELSEHAREIQNQMEDLHNYDLHITDVLRELRDAQSKGTLELTKAFDAAQAALSLNKGIADAHRDVRNALQDVLESADDYRKLAEWPPGKTSVVRLKFGRQILPEGATADTKRGSVERQLESLDAAPGHQTDATKAADLRQSCLKAFQDYMEELRNALTERQGAVQKMYALIDEEGKKTAAQIALLQQAFTKKSQIRQNTFDSVNYMLIVLVIMFVVAASARYFAARLPRNNAVAMIDERTLVEFGGMAFLLLTILILGNTEKLDKEALGPLIGTIAGYIFGKGMANIGQPRADRAGPPHQAP